MKIGGLVQVRLASERLPGKALLPIHGKAAIVHLLERMFRTQALSPERVVVCTTDEASDDSLVPVVEETGACVFRGSSGDLIDRFFGAVRAHGFDAVIQVDGDDICADPQYMDLCAETLVEDGRVDVVLCKGLPLGIASKAIRSSAIERVWRSYVPDDNSTGASLFFTTGELCERRVLTPLFERHTHPIARLTLDYEEDVRFFEAVFEELYRPGEIFWLDEIVELLERRPELVEINGSLADGYMERHDQLVRRERLRYRTPEGVIKELQR